MGFWFDEVPPRWELSKTKVYSDQNAKKIARGIINLPSYWTLSEAEIDEVISMTKYISEL